MVKFAVEFWWKMLLTIFPSKRSSKISFQTSPEVRHQFRRKLRQLHSGNRWAYVKLLENSSPLFQQHEMLSQGLGIFRQGKWLTFLSVSDQNSEAENLCNSPLLRTQQHISKPLQQAPFLLRSPWGGTEYKHPSSLEIRKSTKIHKIPHAGLGPEKK